MSVEVKVLRKPVTLAQVIGLWLPLALVILWAVVAILGPLMPLSPDQISLPHRKSVV